ncbi:hypothetical protein SDC9_207938 [bioreactor metagenome]|uniref:Uncharacterized protein n=1 Tax=bioreactor metagenome TaxID=1076179 RepID=A0A645JKP9_9ZZZZ
MASYQHKVEKSPEESSLRFHQNLVIFIITDVIFQTKEEFIDSSYTIVFICIIRQYNTGRADHRTENGFVHIASVGSHYMLVVFHNITKAIVQSYTSVF